MDWLSASWVGIAVIAAIVIACVLLVLELSARPRRRKIERSSRLQNSADPATQDHAGHSPGTSREDATANGHRDS